MTGIILSFSLYNRCRSDYNFTLNAKEKYSMYKDRHIVTTFLYTEISLILSVASTKASWQTTVLYYSLQRNRKKYFGG